MSFKSDLKQVLKPYYLVNILLSLSYVILKRLPGVCNYLFNVQECEFDGRETEILFFLLIVVMIRTRKAGSVTMINYLSASFVYTKIANLFLWFYADYLLGIIYGIIFILTALLLPEPTYSGHDNVVYFRGLSLLQEEINQNRGTAWLVAFYTMWNPSCVNFAPIFAQLSVELHLDNLRFAKVDVGRFPEAAAHFRINDGSTSRQLPTVILFKEGKEVMRRPTVDTKGKLVNFWFTLDNVRTAFDLRNLYNECKLRVKEQKKPIKID